MSDMTPDEAQDWLDLSEYADTMRRQRDLAVSALRSGLYWHRLGGRACFVCGLVDRHDATCDAANAVRQAERYDAGAKQ